MKESMKQAFLIMAHNNFDYLQLLLEKIDYSFYDIYLHIDKKSNYEISKLNDKIKNANLYFVKRRKITWGGDSQIKCEMELLKAATRKDNYKYLHLISGSDIILKNAKSIFEFFDNSQSEFVSFSTQSFTERNLTRVKYYHFFSNFKNWRNNKFIQLCRRISIKIQSIIKVNRIKKIQVFMGSAWFSITGGFARYLVDNFRKYKKYFNRTVCGDEIFLQTILMDSPYKDNISEMGNLRKIDWERSDSKSGSPYEWQGSDYDELMNSECFFARKVIKKELYSKIFSNI